MKKMFVIIAVTALLTGSLAFTAFAFGPGDGACPAGKGGCGMRGLDSLNLTNEQHQKILAIRQEFEKDTLNLRLEMKRKRRELQRLWAADNLNQAAIDAKTKEMNALRIQMIQKSREMFNKVKAILTPEQIKQLKDRKQNRGRHWRGGCGGGNGCPGFGQ